MEIVEIVVIVAAGLFVASVIGVTLWRKAHGKGGCSACGGCCHAVKKDDGEKTGGCGGNCGHCSGDCGKE